VNLKERPILNSMYIPSVTTPAPRSFDLTTLMYWIKRTPECIGILKRISNDIVTDVTFTAVEKKAKGRPSQTYKPTVEDKANSFAVRNNYKRKLVALVIDWLATGDFYLWTGKITDRMVKETAIKHYKELGIEMKEIETKQFFDEDFNGISALEIVPSTMVRIKHDEFKVLKFHQRDRANPGVDREFNPDEIIHGKFIEIDGNVYGFSPMEAGYTTIRTINSIQDYNWYYFENGAKIDRVWKYMGTPSPDYWKKFKEDVAKYVSVKKAHGHLFVAGAEKIESEVLNEISEKMEHRDLAIHSVGKLAFAFNMAADTLSPILGKDIRQAAGSSDVEDAGYNRNIERAQEYLENLLNDQLWIPFFGVEMRFERTFRQDQIRKIQYMSMAVPVLEFSFRHELPVSDEFIFDLLQIPRKYRTKGKVKREIEQIGQPFQLPNKKTIKGEASQGLQESKKSQQKPQQANNPPLGS
jgi:hypothetical protein